MHKLSFLAIALLMISSTSIAQNNSSKRLHHQLSEQSDKKLDPKIIHAIKNSKTTGNQPNISFADFPIQKEGKVLVDINAKVSSELKKYIIGIGGELDESPAPDHIIRAMVPLKGLEKLAARKEVSSVIPGQITLNSGSKSSN